MNEFRACLLRLADRNAVMDAANGIWERRVVVGVGTSATTSRFEDPRNETSVNFEYRIIGQFVKDGGVS